MPASLPFERYLDALGMATARLHQEALEAGLDAAVLTCRDWSARQLVAHVGTIHRWATAALRGVRDLDTDEVEAEGLRLDDPGAWLMSGAETLEAVLRAAPADLDTWFFLRDAAAPRDAWARRQAHETAIHAVDALSAHLAEWPQAQHVDIDAQFAADGIDELLCGFLTRPHGMRTFRPVTLLVHSTDVARDWTVRLGEAPAVTTPGRDTATADTTWSGTAVQLYLGLWNRGREIEQQGVDLLPAWRQRMTVTWG